VVGHVGTGIVEWGAQQILNVLMFCNHAPKVSNLIHKRKS
jgi:hypothetical protein